MPDAAWQQIKEIFQAAVDLPTAARLDFLNDRCGDDAALRAEVDSLLTHHGSALEPPNTAEVAEVFRRAETGAFVGCRLGPYELVSLIASGGMGHVYLARRADGAFEKEVAVKIIRQSVGNEEVRRRFLTEQQALAALDHANIARLLDGGVTPEGLSYLVMEFVDGVPINAYCDAQRLTITDRLELFRQVCDAVHYAHQRLIVHRDLKPSNILVTADGTPKLLDFGIAKLLDENLPAALFHTTRWSIPFLTPEYASPEQIRGDAITTSSDIYSLGVILYELLTGRRPHTLSRRSPQEITTAIAEQTPPRPSTLLHLSRASRPADPPADAAPAPEEISRSRNAEPEALVRRLVGDLDNICLMALRKEPARRYGSADQFSEDIRRHLVGMPVIARRDTFLYRSLKFIQRNRAAVFATAVLFLALTAGVIGTSLSLVYVERARRETTLMNEFLNEMLAQADVNNTGRDLTVREMLDRAGERVAADFQNHPDVEAGLRATIGNAYLSLGLPEAGPHLRRAYELRRTINGDQNQEVIDSLHSLAVFEYVRGNLDDAERLATRALKEQTALTGAIDKRYVNILDDLAVIIRTTGDYARAEPLYREALALNRHLYGPSNPETAKTLNNYAVLLKLMGNLDRAEAMYRECVVIRRSVEGGSNLLATSLSNLAALLQSKGAYRRAEAIYREALAIQQKNLGSNHPAVAVTQNNLAMLLLSIGRLDEAETLFQQALATDQVALGSQHVQVATILFNLGALNEERGEYAVAMTLYEDAYEIRRKGFSGDHPDVATSLTGLGTASLALGQTDEAEGYLNASLQMRKRLFPGGHAVLALSLDPLAKLAVTRRDLPQAESLAREALAVRRDFQPPAHPDIAAGMMRLAVILMDENQYDEADQLLTEALDRIRNGGYATYPIHIQILHELGRLAAARHLPDTARQFWEEAHRRGIEVLGEAHPEVKSLEKLLG